MQYPNAGMAAQQLVKMGLIKDPQLDEVWDEVGGKSAEAESLILALERKGYLTPWQSGKFLRGDTDGFLLGGYKILYKIASGSFGRVFRAQDELTGRVVAIKVLRRRWSEDQQRIDLFDREGKVGLSLRHPNIVEILNVNVDKKSGQYYIVMEFVEGANLREILQIRKKLEPLEAIKIIEDAANGLAYAYGRGITHRDMKLTNILIGTQGVAKLVDFGLAKMFGAPEGRDGKGGRDGKEDKDGDKVERTVDYAGLERGTGVMSGDIRSDIYFLGCVLYEILTGRPPLEMTRDKHARMQKHRFDSVKPMGRDEVKGPPSLFRLVETMMELHPQRRYQTPAQLLEAIRSVRRELENQAQGGKGPVGPRTLFVVEQDARLQDALREKLKEQGYKVLLAADPVRAMDRFRQHPYDGLIVDAGTTGEEGLLVFDRVAAEADRQGLSCGAVLILNEEQADWRHRVKARPTVTVMVRPVTLKQLMHKLQALVPSNGTSTTA